MDELERGEQTIKIGEARVSRGLVGSSTLCPGAPEMGSQTKAPGKTGKIQN